MATINRPKPQNIIDEQQELVEGSIPSPFPTHLITDQEAGPETLTSQPKNGSFQDAAMLRNIHALSSLILVQQSCMLTLNALLAPYSPRWRPIPVLPKPRSSPVAEGSFSPSTFALRTILQNLPGTHSAFESQNLLSESDQLAELERRTSDLLDSAVMGSSDGELAAAIVTLLSNAQRVLRLCSGTQIPPPPPLDWEDKGNVYRILENNVVELKNRRVEVESSQKLRDTPVTATQKALAWNQVDGSLETILELCSRRGAELPIFRPSHESEAPPRYEIDPPSYDTSFPEKHILRHAHTSPDLHLLSAQSASSEKMRLELDNVTMAIDRLYSLAPQLHNQRVELRPEKQNELELARIWGAVQKMGNRLDHQRAAYTGWTKPTRMDSVKGKAKANENADLDGLLDLIDRSQRPRMPDQRAMLSDEVRSRLRQLEAIKARESASIDDLAERLRRNAEAGRIRAQDAAFSPRAVSHGNLRDELEVSSAQTGFLGSLSRVDTRGSSSGRSTNVSPNGSLRVKKKKSFLSRERSNSAPSRWFTKPIPVVSTLSLSSQITDVQYVAEFQENLRNVHVFLHHGENEKSIASRIVDAVVEESESSASSTLRLQFDGDASKRVILPALVSPGPMQIQDASDHSQARIRSSDRHSLVEAPPVLDAAYLTHISPTSFICSSCSLPLAQRFAKPMTYSDLPSEHWGELVESWMCHNDQKLSSTVAGRGKSGFWPTETRAFVGGSYVLFDEHVVVTENIKVSTSVKHGKDWHRTNCLCGAILGGCQDSLDGGSRAFRLAMYAVRPVGPLLTPFRLPLTSFVLADMMEYVQSHATYRFIIRDEEDEKVRILVWLFNPSIHVSYAWAKAYAIPKSGSIPAAKVFFKLIGPTENLDTPEIYAKYPDFTSAEHLYYPFNVCRSLAAVLLASNRVYPLSRRSMNDLEMGWLSKA